MVNLAAAETKTATLSVKADDSSLVFRAGPVKLPAGAGSQPAGFTRPLEYAVTRTGDAVAFRLRVTDASGAELPGRLLQLASIERRGQNDLLCPAQAQRLFLAYSAPWLVPEFPGIGFPLKQGDKIGFTGELHNPTDRDYPEVYIELRMYFRERGKSQWPVTSAVPMWIEVSDCGQPPRDLAAGHQVKRREFQAPRSGKILALAATGSEYTARLLLERLPSEVLADVTRREPGTGTPWQADGAFPLVNWMPRGGTSIESGQRFRITAEFDSPAAVTLRAAGRAAILAYFLPFEPK